MPSAAPFDVVANTPIYRQPTKDTNLWDGGETYQGPDRTLQLTRRMDELVIRIDDPSWQPQGALTGFTISKTINPTTLVLQAPASTHFVPDDSSISIMARTSGVSWAGPVYTELVRPNDWMITTDELVVRLDEGVDAAQFFAGEAMAQSYRPLPGTPDQFVVTLVGGGGSRAFAASNAMDQESGVLWAEPNYVQSWHAMYTPNDPLFSNQWHLENSGASGGKADADVDATSAWDVTTGSSSVVVAVIDDSVQIDHPDLTANIFTNPGEVAGNGIDDDGNGWVDDVHGYDFAHFNTQADPYDNDPSPGTSDDNHGTNVAGVIAAKGDNTLGVAGVAYNVRILPVRIGLGGTFTTDADIAAGVYYAAGRTKNGLGTWNAAQITNNSWGGGGLSQTLIDSFTWSSNSARGGKGVLNFVAAGNGGYGAISSPAILSGTLSGVMAIGASTNSDVRSSYSQWGPELDLVAPSSGGTLGIQTTDRTGTDGYTSTDYNDGFGGTSSATPLSAGIGALVLSRDLNLTAAQIRGLLHNTTDLIGPLAYDSTGKNLEYGYGRVNANTAVRGVGVAEIQVLNGTADVADGSTMNVSSYGQAVDVTLRVRNQGTVDLTLGTPTLAAGSFSIVQGFGDSTLSVGESTTLVVRFAPTVAGVQSRVLSFATNDANEGTFDITLNGTGIGDSISGRVFEDFNGNQFLGASEPGLAGWRVIDDGNNNGVWDTSTATFNSTDVPVTIDDFTTASSTISISGAVGTLQDLNVKLNITHTYDSDLQLILVSPDGTSITLSNSHGSSGDDYTDTIFDDQAATAIADGDAPFTGSFRPEGSLAVVNGTSLNGTWTLQVYDQANQDTGTINSWSLIATSATEASALTSANGEYALAPNLSAGFHTVRLVPQVGYNSTSPGSSTVMVTSGAMTTGVNFGVARQDTAYGRLFDDVNSNGIDNSEAPLVGWRVFDDSDGDDTWDVSSTTFNSTNVPLPLPDVTTVTSTISVSGVVAKIQDINVNLDLTHTYDGDLQITLISPAGTRILLSNRRGGPGAGFTGTTFDDQASVSIAGGTAPFTGSFRPDEPLTIVNGASANGTWTLEVADKASGDSGTLNSWSLQVTSAEQSTVTDANGYYALANLPSGARKLRRVLQSGYVGTSPVSGVYSYTHVAGASDFNKDFGQRLGTTAPTISSVTFGDGTNQRSLVKQIVVNFSEPVNFTGLVASAFTLFRHGTGSPTGNVTLNANPAVGPASSVTITFSGSLSEFGSLVDGFYDFTIDASKISTPTGGNLDGDGVGGAGGNYVVIGSTANKYFRFFGDSDGSSVTDLGDFAAFRSVFNLGANAVFDFDNSGNVDLGDFAQFRSRFNLSP